MRTGLCWVIVIVSTKGTDWHARDVREPLHVVVRGPENFEGFSPQVLLCQAMNLASLQATLWQLPLLPQLHQLPAGGEHAMLSNGGFTILSDPGFSATWLGTNAPRG